MKFIIILSLLFGFNSLLAEAGSKKGSVKGNIYDKNIDKPVEFANITIYSKHDSTLISGAISDANGDFIISNLAYGEYYLEANFIGYEKQVIQDISLNQQKPVSEISQIVLTQSQEQLDGVEVVGERNYIDYKVDKKVVNVSQHINASGGSAADVLENVPSVKVDIDGNVTLRGSGSFTVLVDGRPSPVSASDLLKQLPASTIDKIEIITNPSAKYDPDGTAGIINIIMKKEKLKGMNGVFNIIGNSKGGYSGSANVNYRKAKTNYFINTSYTRDPTVMVSENKRETYFSDTIGLLTENTDREQIMQPWRFNAGLDHYFNDSNMLTFSGTVGGFGFFRYFDTEYHATNDQNTFNDYSVSDNNFEVDGIYYAGNIFYQHKFAPQNHNLEFTMNAWQWKGNNYEESFEHEANAQFDPIANPTNKRSIHNPTRNNIVAKVDYVRPLWNGKLEAGANAHITFGESAYSYDNYDFVKEVWVSDESRNNGFDFNQEIYAVYGTFSSHFKKLTYQLGLRLEHTYRLIDQKTMGEKYELNLFNYYPSIHISHPIGKTQQLQASYSRRINRPRPWELNPFPDFADRYNVSFGNPLLEPEDVNSLELNYLNRFTKAIVSVGVYYRQTHNTKIMSQNITPENPEMMIVTYENLDMTSALGTELMFNYDFNKKFSTSLGGNYFQYTVSSIIAERSQLQDSRMWDARLSATYKVTDKTRFQLVGTYNGPGYQGQGYISEFYAFNFAFRHDFLKRRATVSLNIRDIFSTSKYETVVTNDDFYSYFYLKQNSPVFRIALSYRLNNYQRKKNIDVGGR